MRDEAVGTTDTAAWRFWMVNLVCSCVSPMVLFRVSRKGATILRTYLTVTLRPFCCCFRELSSRIKELLSMVCIPNRQLPAKHSLATHPRRVFAASFSSQYSRQAGTWQGQSLRGENQDQKHTFAISSPTFFGDRPSGPIFGARADEAPTSPPVARR
jgi:hypothetical protein